MDKVQRLEKIRELREFVNQINNESTKDSLILVEGKRDLEVFVIFGLFWKHSGISQLQKQCRFGG